MFRKEFLEITILHLSYENSTSIKVKVDPEHSCYQRFAVYSRSMALQLVKVLSKENGMHHLELILVNHQLLAYRVGKYSLLYVKQNNLLAHI